MLWVCWVLGLDVLIGFIVNILVYFDVVYVFLVGIVDYLGVGVICFIFIKVDYLVLFGVEGFCDFVV